MIKKTTLLVLLGAIVMGAAVYYLDWRRGEKEKEKGPADAAKSAFANSSGAEIISISLTRPAAAGEPAIRLEKRDGAWRIVAPLQTDASEQAVQRLADGIATAHISETLPGTPDRLKVYGLESPAVSIEFQLQNGAKHSLKLGEKDFTGVSVYAIVDDGKDVALLPQSLLTSTITNVETLRNHSVLAISEGNIAGFDLKNSSGETSLVKDKSGWKFTKPGAATGDNRDVNALLSAVTSNSFASIASEAPDNPGKYGLSSPSVTFTALDAKGKSATLLVGKKDGAEYFARDTSRPMIFRISESLYKQLAVNYAALRDKTLVHVDQGEVKRIEARDENGTVIINRKADKDDDWTFEAPEDRKGKPATAWKIFSPLMTARAEEVLEHPSAEVTGRLAKPALDITLTDKSGKKWTLEISKVSGDFVYARTSEGPAIYKLKKQIMEQLNFKADDFSL